MIKSSLHHKANHRILGIIRCGIFCVWFVIIINAPIQNYALLPEENFSPWGFSRILFSALPDAGIQFILSSGFLIGFKYLLAICCLLCLLGIRPWKILAAGTAVMLLLFDGIVQGFYGFANHAQLGIQYCAVILAMFPCSDGWSILGDAKKEEKQNIYRAAVFLCALALCIPYMFIGMHRILYGGPEIFTGDAILHYLSVRDLQYAELNINFNPFILDYPSLFPMVKFGFFVITVFEASTPFLLLDQKFRRVWLTVIIPLHLFTLIAMNIFFWENLVLILLLFTNLPYVINKIDKRISIRRILISN